MNNLSLVHIIQSEIRGSLNRLRPAFKWAMTLLLLGFLVGVIVGYFDLEILKIFIGESRTSMIIGRAMDVLSFPNVNEVTPGLMLFQLSGHNILLAAIAFLGGTFLGLISAYLLAYNAIIIGFFTFQVFSFHGLETFQSSILLHGTIEILAFLVCTGAGFNMATAFVKRDGKLHRRARLIQAFKDGVLMFMCMIPLFLLAGIIEAFFVNHFPTISVLLNLSLGIGYAFLFSFWLFGFSSR